MKSLHLLLLLHHALTIFALISPAIFFETPGPIFHFEATAIVPPTFSNTIPKPGAHGLWTGLSTSNATVSLRNVIAKLGTEWNLASEYCCK